MANVLWDDCFKQTRNKCRVYKQTWSTEKYICQGSIMRFEYIKAGKLYYPRYTILTLHLGVHNTDAITQGCNVVDLCEGDIFFTLTKATKTKPYKEYCAAAVITKYGSGLLYRRTNSFSDIREI